METARFAALCRPDGEGLPHTDPAPARVRIIITALASGWTRLRAHMASAGEPLSTLTEDQTTTLLVDALEWLLAHEAIPGFAPEFYSVARDPKVVNYDGHHPDKMPDLVFSLRPARPGLPGDYGLHVECKPVGLTHGHAHADPGYTFADKVLPTLHKDFGQPADTHATTLLPDIAVDPPASHHRRDWCYANGAPPGDIRLLHVWLTR